MCLKTCLLDPLAMWPAARRGRPQCSVFLLLFMVGVKFTVNPDCVKRCSHGMRLRGRADSDERSRKSRCVLVFVRKVLGKGSRCFVLHGSGCTGIGTAWNLPFRTEEETCMQHSLVAIFRRVCCFVLYSVQVIRFLLQPKEIEMGQTAA